MQIRSAITTMKTMTTATMRPSKKSLWNWYGGRGEKEARKKADDDDCRQTKRKNSTSSPSSSSRVGKT